ncbi:hypothetical protein ACSS6W_009761 [Trichoderma asperelloides]
MKFSSTLLTLLPVALATPIAVASPEAPAPIAARGYEFPRPCPEYDTCVEQKGQSSCNVCMCNPNLFICTLIEGIY